MNKSKWKFEQIRSIRSKVICFEFLITLRALPVWRSVRSATAAESVRCWRTTSHLLYAKFHISFFLYEMSTKFCFFAWVWHAFLDSACILERTMLKYYSKFGRKKRKGIWNFVYIVNEELSENTSYTFDQHCWAHASINGRNRNIKKNNNFWTDRPILLKFSQFIHLIFLHLLHARLSQGLLSL